MITTSVRLPKEYMEKIEEMCELECVDKGAMLRRLLGSALSGKSGNNHRRGSSGRIGEAYKGDVAFSGCL